MFVCPFPTAAKHLASLIYSLSGANHGDLETYSCRILCLFEWQLPNMLVSFTSVLDRSGPLCRLTESVGPFA